MLNIKPRKAAILLLTTMSIAVSMATAAEPDRIFTKAPAPEVLANILYGTKYRGVAASDTGGEGRFGMMINFDYNSTKIVPKSLPLLDSVGEMLQLNATANEVLVIEGHADASGSEAYNLDLSERRADAIKRYLIGSFDLAAERLVTIGEGETKLHNSKNPLDAVNRRVVFRSDRSITVD